MTQENLATIIKARKEFSITIDAGIKLFPLPHTNDGLIKFCMQHNFNYQIFDDLNAIVFKVKDKE